MSGIQVTITGMNFLNPKVTQVYFDGGLQTASIVSQSDRALVVTVPSLAVIGQIGVENADNTIFTINNFIAGAVVTNFVRQTPAPTSDADGITGKPGDVVFIEGINFEDDQDAGFGVSVYFGGVRATTFETRGTTALVATIPALAVTGPITVINPGGGIGTVTNFYIPPVVTSFTARGTIGSTNIIVGRSFVGVTRVLFGGVDAQSFVIQGGTNILAVVPANVPTSGPITVSAPGGDFVTTTSFLLLPSISGFTPAGGAEGSTVTLSGTGLTGANRVSFGGIAATPASVSATSVKALVPRGALTGPISVVTPNGTNTSSAIFYVAPAILSVNPSQGTAGQMVTLSGRNFLGATQVGFSNAVTTVFNVVNNTTLTVNVPSNALTGPIRVTAPGGVGVSPQFFSVIGPVPVVKSFTPSSGPPGIRVQIYGDHLGPATSVKFNGVAAPNFQILSDTNLAVTVPPSASSGLITVTSPFGQGSSTAKFIVGTTADLSLTMSANLNPPIVGSDLILSFSLRNLGPITAVAPQATLTAPSGVALITADPGPGTYAINGNNIIFSFPDLLSGSVFSGTITANVQATNFFSLTLAANSITPDNNPGNNSATLSLSPEPLTLSIQPVIGGDLHISWPAIPGSLVLKSTPALAPATWTAVTNVPDTDGSRDFINLSPTRPRLFFRLASP